MSINKYEVIKRSIHHFRKNILYVIIKERKPENNITKEMLFTSMSSTNPPRSSNYLSRDNRLYSLGHVTDDQRMGFEKELSDKKQKQEAKIVQKQKNMLKARENQDWKTCKCFDGNMTEKEKLYLESTPF